MPKHIDWLIEFQPLFRKFKGRKHPLEYKSIYQLIVMVILSARDSDKKVNKVAPELFKHYGSMKELARAKAADLHPYVRTVTNFRNKSKWLVDLARSVKEDDNIPKSLEELTALTGIGRKSANVIISESGGKMEGVIVDLHVVRTTPRIGIASGTNPVKIEQELMKAIPQKHWRELGMSLTFLGREICRPTDPHCPECPVNKVCEYYNR